MHHKRLISIKVIVSLHRSKRPVQGNFLFPGQLCILGPLSPETHSNQKTKMKKANGNGEAIYD